MVVELLTVQVRVRLLCNGSTVHDWVSESTTRRKRGRMETITGFFESFDRCQQAKAHTKAGDKVRVILGPQAGADAHRPDKAVSEGARARLFSTREIHCNIIEV